LNPSTAAANPGIVLLLHENTLIKGLMGSEMGALFYRALGAKIGKNTCIMGPLYW
jgi:hypothetical protein